MFYRALIVVSEKKLRRGCAPTTSRRDNGSKDTRTYENECKANGNKPMASEILIEKS